MAKRNISYIKPEDPAFLKALKKEAGYDDRNHKFDDLQNADQDFVDDEESELPQVVVLKAGDLTAEEAEVERIRIEKEESETKADLNQRVLFKPKNKDSAVEGKKRKGDSKKSEANKKSKSLLSFDIEEEEAD